MIWIKCSWVSLTPIKKRITTNCRNKTMKNFMWCKKHYKISKGGPYEKHI